MEYRIAPLRNYNEKNNTRKCRKCNEWLDLSNFSSRIRKPSPTTKDEEKKVATLYYRSTCKKCSLKSVNVDKYCSKEVRREQHRKDPRKVMLIHARSRAKQKDLDFNIDYSDIIVPEFCPLLGIKLEIGNGKAHEASPTIDRLDNNKGYVKGNVLVVSYKANSAKSNLTLEELELLINNLKRVLYKEDELLES
jgi:archaellum component FlaC